MISSTSPHVLGDAESWRLKDVYGGGMFRRPPAWLYWRETISTKRLKGPPSKRDQIINQRVEKWSYIWEIIMMEEWKRFLSNRRTAGGFAGSAERRLSFELKVDVIYESKVRRTF
jgi:hypothetical protein